MTNMRKHQPSQMCRLCGEKRRQSGCDGCCMRCAKQVGVTIRHDARRCLRCPAFRQSGCGGLCISCAQDAGIRPQSGRGRYQTHEPIDEPMVIAPAPRVRAPRYIVVDRVEYEVVFDGSVRD